MNTLEPVRPHIKHSPMLWSFIQEGHKRTPLVLEASDEPLQIECRKGILYVNPQRFLSMTNQIKRNLNNVEYLSKIEEKWKKTKKKYSKITIKLKVAKEENNFRAVRKWEDVNKDFFPFLHYNPIAAEHFAGKLKNFIESVVKQKKTSIEKEKLVSRYLSTALSDLWTETRKLDAQITEITNLVRSNEYLLKIFKKHDVEELKDELKSTDVWKVFKNFAEKYSYLGGRDFLESTRPMEYWLSAIKSRLLEKETLTIKPNFKDMEDFWWDVNKFRSVDEFIELRLLARKFTRENEDEYHIWMKGKMAARELLESYARELAAGNFLTQEEDIFYLKLSEVFSGKRKMKRIVKSRKKKWLI